MNRRFLADWDGDPIPDANEEYFIYQTLVGTWPVTPLDEAERETYADRIVQYMEKALREAKLHTSWMNPSEEYETRCLRFRTKDPGTRGGGVSDAISVSSSRRLPTPGS